MNTVRIDGITISIGCEILAVRRVTPKKSVLKEFWRNNYFRRNTKQYLTVKAAEWTFRSIGIHQLYLLLNEHLLPYLPILISFLRSIDWNNMIFRIDIGFACGVATAYVLRRLASFVRDFLTKGRGLHES